MVTRSNHYNREATPHRLEKEKVSSVYRVNRRLGPTEKERHSIHLRVPGIVTVRIC